MAYGVRNAIFMGMTNPAVAATQFTAFMGMANMAISIALLAGNRRRKPRLRSRPSLDALFAVLVILVIPSLREREEAVGRKTGTADHCCRRVSGASREAVCSDWRCGRGR